MRTLIVGAGAVGQVYGRHLSLGGAAVSFLVKPKYRAAAAEGYRLYPLNGRNRTEPVKFEGFGVIDSVEAAIGQPWDQLWLTVSADALLGDWLDTLITGMPADCVLVCLSPGQLSYQRLVGLVGEERVISGMINLIAYQAPLPGEERFSKPGVAYWFPPLSPSPFSGPGVAVKQVCDTLRRGGQPASVHADVQSLMGFPQAILMTHLLALEAAGWTFAGLSAGDALESARAGASEALSIVAEKNGVARSRLLALWRPAFVRLGLKFAPMLVPLDLEVYLAYHFQKVREQTLLFVKQYIEWGEAQGRSVVGLKRLLSGVEG
jgi:2-dehydropantoate 2-reductase